LPNASCAITHVKVDSMPKRISFTLKIAGMQIIILALVTVTGLFAYEKFTGVVEGISEKLTPSSRLVKAGELLNHLDEAEINAKSYSLTRDTLYLDQFYFSAQKVEADLDQLQILEEQDSLDSETSEKLGTLINQKFTILRDLILLKDKFRVEQSLDRVNKKITSELLDSNIQQPTTLLQQTETKSETETAVPVIEEPEEVSETETETGKENKKKKLGWLFKKNELPVTESPVIPPSVTTTTTTTTVTTIPIVTNDSVIQQSFSNITREIKIVRTGETRIERELRKKELDLILEDERLNAEISEQLEHIREEERAKIAEEAKLAEKTIDDTKIQIAWFCFFIVVLLVFMAVVITNYVRTNSKYREALRMAKRNAEDLSKAKQNFLANISHEIRTPINAIAGFTEQLSSSSLSQAQNEQIRIIQKSTEHLTYLINDLLDFSKLEAGKITFEKIAFHPAELIADVLAVASNQAGKKPLALNADIDPEIPETLIGDPYRLKQILLNLYSNSIKFTESGYVNLETKVVLRSEKEVSLLFIVTDTGIGMTPEQVDKIFTEFEQANETITRKFGGTGLGLSIVRMLTDKLGGKIRIESEEGVGTKTMIEIPYLVATETETVITDDTEKTVECEEIRAYLLNLRVLIVDDEEYNRKLLAAILKKYNAIYTEAADGIEAIDELDRNDYDVILMDARMPKLNGIETTIRIRQMRDPKKSGIPILGISASTSEQDRKDYRDSGMNASIQKPFKETLLLSEIYTIVKNANAKTGLSENGRESSYKIKSNIHFKDLQEMCDGDTTFYADMLRTFIEGTNEGLKKIRDAYAHEDYEALGGQAHKIAAPCNHIGAIQLYGLLKKIEEIVRDKQDPQQLADLVVKVQEEAIGVIEITQRELDSVKV
jgi:signal transduction histidine kinase/DNA-binding response OmpR family regulator